MTAEAASKSGSLNLGQLRSMVQIVRSARATESGASSN